MIQSSSLDGSTVQSNKGIIYQNQLHVGPPNAALNRNLHEHNSFFSPNCISAEQKGKISTSIPNNGCQLVSHSTSRSNFSGQGVSPWNANSNEEDIYSSHIASRFELKLGQPPNLVSNSSKGIIPTSMQLTTVINVQTTQSSQTAVNKGESNIIN
jgi:hypothetical protein